jgi:hypothetical protein
LANNDHQKKGGDRDNGDRDNGGGGTFECAAFLGECDGSNSGYFE